MKARKADIIAIFIIVLSFLTAIYIYPQMPEKSAGHWNAAGQVDGYVSREVAVFLMPFLSLFLYALFYAIPKIDPLRKNIEKFRSYFDGFIVLLIGFLFYLYILTILWNFGFRINMMIFLVPAFAIIFYYCGVLIEHSHTNWFIGIRTPWTMSNKTVWKKTHERGGKLFKTAGIIAIFGILFDAYAIWFVLVPVIIAAVYTFVYSYFVYKNIVKNKSKKARKK